MDTVCVDMTAGEQQQLVVTAQLQLLSQLVLLLAEQLEAPAGPTETHSTARTGTADEQDRARNRSGTSIWHSMHMLTRCPREGLSKRPKHDGGGRHKEGTRICSWQAGFFACAGVCRTHCPALNALQVRTSCLAGWLRVYLECVIKLLCGARTRRKHVVPQPPPNPPHPLMLLSLGFWVWFAGHHTSRASLRLRSCQMMVLMPAAATKHLMPNNSCKRACSSRSCSCCWCAPFTLQTAAAAAAAWPQPPLLLVMMVVVMPQTQPQAASVGQVADVASSQVATTTAAAQAAFSHSVTALCSKGCSSSRRGVARIASSRLSSWLSRWLVLCRTATQAAYLMQMAPQGSIMQQGMSPQEASSSSTGRSCGSLAQHQQVLLGARQEMQMSHRSVGSSRSRKSSRCGAPSCRCC